MIKIENLKVEVEKKEIIKGLTINFELGKNYLLLGKNGSGKSSLSSFLMGHPKYRFKEGEVLLEGENLLNMSPEERSKKGLFLSFQHIPEIKGIRLSEYLRVIYNIHLKNTKSDIKELSPFIFKRFVKKFLDELDIEDSFLDRELNVGFSGGEKRKIEILQMKLIGPKYIILDEIDSGLDLDAFRNIADMLKDLSNENNTLIIITHYFKILEYIDVDKVYVMKDGKIIKSGDSLLAKEISETGFAKL